MSKKTKALVSSAVAIALCANVVAGATYALFTSQDSVNIAVTSGTVAVKAGVSDFQYKTLTQDWTAATKNGEVYESTFDGIGGKATLNGKTITLDKVVPGDAVKFKVNITNESTVNVKYRVIVAKANDTGLFGGLDVMVDGEEFAGEEVGDWTELAPTDAVVQTIPVEIELPQEAGNEFQGKATDINVMVEAVQGNAPTADVWDGTADSSWFNKTEDEANNVTSYTLNKASQIAGLADLVDAGETFEGKTIQLAGDLNFEAYDANNERVSFDPIGSYKYDKCFTGIFDGQGHTVSNMNQNGWALENGYYENDLGLGLFGKVKNATIKNVSFDGVNQPSEFNLIGTVAGAAYGECTFENITVSNSYMGNHSYYSGGIVGWASGTHRYINCDIDETTSISSQWGDFNNANGGLIGGAGSSGTYYFEDCDVACRIDAYNDCTSAYEWFTYRNVGMLIGNTNHTQEINGATYAAAPNVECKNCTVTYGAWSQYTYCQFSAMAYPWARVQAGDSTNAYGNARYTGLAIDANGNEVVDENHAHNPGEAHHELHAFDQLFGGPGGDRYCTYGLREHPGVTVVYNNK